MARILVVEDAVEAQQLLTGILSDLHELVFASSVAECLNRLETGGEFGLILLDAMLPDGDGFELCKQMRENPATSSIPIIVVTGKGGISDKVTGFSLGADDYVVKPFDPLELRARVDAKLKRPPPKSDEPYRKGDLIVNVGSQRAFLLRTGEKDPVDLGLTPIELKILYLLVRNEGKLLTRAQLLEEIWGNQHVHVVDRTVDKHICSLRTKLSNKASYIRTIPRAGYVFSAAEGGK
jgi:two-component system phosphate regulon response regulator PhoB